MAAEKESNIIFDFTWGNTYGLFSEGYHLMIKGGGDLYLTWSVDLKYGEVALDNAKLDEFMKDLKALRLDTWNGRTYSDSNFENGDTWRVEANHIAFVLESKGANDYPPEWKQFLEYLHVKWSVPVSSRELPEQERKEILKRREKEEQTSKSAEKQERTDRKDGRRKNQSGNNNAPENKNAGKEKRDNKPNNKERQGQGGSNGKKREQPKAPKDRNFVKDKERRQNRPKLSSENESEIESTETAAKVNKIEKPRKFRYHRKRNNSGKKAQE